MSSRLTRAETERLRWYHQDSDGQMGARGIDYSGPWAATIEPDDAAMHAVRQWRRVSAVLMRCSHRTQAIMSARWQSGRIRHETGLRGELVGLLPRTDTISSLAEVEGTTPLAVLIALAASKDDTARRTLLAASCETQGLWDAAEEEYSMLREQALDAAALEVAL